MDDWVPLSLLSCRRPASFERRVVVERGEIHLEHLDGSLYSFACGAGVCVDRLPLRALHNRGREPAVLVAVARRISAARR